MRLALAAAILCATATAAHAEDAIAYGDGGLRIGATVVFTKPVNAAAYDENMDLVWINTKGTLQVLDLRKTPPKVTVIAKKMPEGGFEIAGASTATTGNVYAMVYPVLRIGKSSKLAAAEGAYGELDLDPDGEKQARKRIKKIKIVGKKWLKALAKREGRYFASLTSTPDRVKLPAGMAACDDEEMCGEAQWLGSYQLVTIEQSCGDACFLGCALHDPKTGKFASPAAATTRWGDPPVAGPCDGYAVSDDGTTYLIGSMRCTLGAKLACTEDAGWTYVDWTP